MIQINGNQCNAEVAESGAEYARQRCKGAPRGGGVEPPRTPLATPLCTLVMRKILFNQFIGTRRRDQ